MGVGVKKRLKFSDGSTFCITCNTAVYDVRALAAAGPSILRPSDSGTVKITGVYADGRQHQFNAVKVEGEYWQATDKQRGRRLLINASSAAIEYDHPRPPRRVTLWGALKILEQLNAHNFANGLPAFEPPPGVVNLAKHETFMPAPHRPAPDAQGWPGTGDAGDALWVSPRGECWLVQPGGCRRVARAVAVRWLASNDYQTIPAALVAPPAVRGVVGDKEDGK